MKRLLQLGFVLGLVGTLAIAYALPLFPYERYRSATTVQVNGGRLERFLVQLPADRVGMAIESPGSSRAEAAGALQLEHFKLRDKDSNVIGVAARHVVPRTGGDLSSWIFTIPSRGTVVFAGDISAAGTIREAVAGRGLTPGQSVEPPLSVELGGTLQSVTGTGEFAGIDFQLVETWEVTGIEDNGQVRGTLFLNTVGMLAQ